MLSPLRLTSSFLPQAAKTVSKGEPHERCQRNRGRVATGTSLPACRVCLTGGQEIPGAAYGSTVTMPCMYGCTEQEYI